MQIVKVYGPYSRKQDKRKIVVLRLQDGKLTTKSYARFLYEQEHGLIEGNLTVDHINDKEWDDRLENFQLLTLEDNIRKSKKIPKMFYGVCPNCGNEFSKSQRAVNHNQGKQNKAGPFCSKSCAGSYGKNIQLKTYLIKDVIIIS